MQDALERCEWMGRVDLSVLHADRSRRAVPSAAMNDQSLKQLEAMLGRTRG